MNKNRVILLITVFLFTIFTINVVYSLDTYELPLVAGWNLVSLPLKPIDNTTAVVFNPTIIGDYKLIAWDPGIYWNPGIINDWDKWNTYDVRKPDFLNPPNLKTIDTKHGYWMQVGSNVTVNIQGSIQEITEYWVKGPGWNLIGYPSVGYYDPDYTFNNVSNEINAVWTFDPDIGKWLYYKPNDPSSNLTHMRPGRGYWVDIKSGVGDSHWFFDGKRFRKYTVLPDLSVYRVEFNQSNPDEFSAGIGEDVRICADIHNDGLIPSGPVWVYFNDAINWKELGRTELTNAWPFVENYACIDYKNVTYYPEIGGMRIRVYIDSYNLVNEYNENDNVYFSRLTVRVPDLYVGEDDITFKPLYPIEGENVKISYKVWNIGDYPANNIWVGFWNCTIGVGCIGMPSEFINNIPNGAYRIVNKTVYNLQSNRYIYHVVTDDTGWILESDEGNNYINKTLYVPKGPEVNLSIGYTFSPRHSGLPIADDKINVSAQIRNTGDFPADNVSVEFWYVPPGGSKTLLDNVSIPHIEPNQMNWTISNKSIGPVINGFYNVSVKSFTPRTGETKENWMNVTVRSKQPDFTIFNFSITPEYDLTKTNRMFLKVNVTNIGRTDSYFDIKFYRVTNKVLTQIGSTITTHLYPGYSSTLDSYWDMDVSGYYNLTVKVDPENSVPEQDENNNNMTIYYVFIRDLSADLYTTNLIIDPENPMEGELVNLKSKIYNIGDLDSNSFLTTFFNGSSKINDIYTSNLAPWYYTYVEDYWRAEPIGSQKITVYADSGKDVSEYDENNNNYSKTVNVKERPFSVELTSDGYDSCYKDEDAEISGITNGIKTWTMSNSQKDCKWKCKLEVSGVCLISWYDCDWQDTSRIRGIVYKTFRVDGPSGINTADVKINYRYAGLVDSYSPDSTLFPIGAGYWEVKAKIGIIEGGYNCGALDDKRFVLKSETITNARKTGLFDTLTGQAQTTLISESADLWSKKLGSEVGGKALGGLLTSALTFYDTFTGDAVIAEDWSRVLKTDLETGKTYTVFLYVDSATSAGGGMAYAYSDFYYHEPHNADRWGSQFKDRGIWLDDVRITFGSNLDVTI
jgi:subtilase family serine protease